MWLGKTTCAHQPTEGEVLVGSKYKKMRKRTLYGEGGYWGKKTELYVIWDGKPPTDFNGWGFWYYKIGISIDPKKRLTALRTSLPRAQIVWTSPVKDRIEDVVHRYLKKNHKRGDGAIWWDIREWFWVQDGLARGPDMGSEFQAYIEAIIMGIYQRKIDSRGYGSIGYKSLYDGAGDWTLTPSAQASTNRRVYD